jgi:hypothetical protein
MAIGKIVKKVIKYKDFVYIPISVSFKDVKGNKGNMVFKFVRTSYNDVGQFIVKVGISGNTFLVYETTLVVGKEIDILTELVNIFTEQPVYARFTPLRSNNLRLNFKVARIHNFPCVRFSPLFSDYDLYISWSEINKIVDRIKEVIVEMSIIKPFYMELP